PAPNAAAPLSPAPAWTHPIDTLDFARDAPTTGTPSQSPLAGGAPGAGADALPAVMQQVMQLVQALMSMLQQGGAGASSPASSPAGAAPTAGPRASSAPRAGAPTNGAPAASRGGVNVDGPEGFLFKPASDSDGKLAVLLPKQMTGNVDSVTIKD